MTNQPARASSPSPPTSVPVHLRAMRHLESLQALIEAVLGLNEQVHRMVLDVALLVALINALPTDPWIFEAQLAFGLIANAWMIRSIGARWGFPGRHGPLAWLMLVLGLIGALAVSIAVFVGVYSVGLFYPVVRSWSRAAAAFAFTLSVGRAANDFYLSARQVNPRRLRSAMRRWERTRREEAQANEAAAESESAAGEPST